MQEKDSITQFTHKYERANKAHHILMSRFFDTIASLVPPDAHNFLEAGCGAGYSAEALMARIRPQKFSASDVDPELVALTKKRVPGIIATTESIYDLKHPDKSFDLIFSLEVFEHLEKPEKALKELLRVTKKYVIISVPNEPLWRILNALRGSHLSSFGNTPGHINHWSKRTLSKFISKEFTVIKVKKTLPWLVALAVRND